VQQFSIDLQDKVIRPRAHIQEYFAQDDWKATSRLTINAGLRWTLNFPSTEVDNQGAVFNPQTQVLDYLGQDGNSRSARELHPSRFRSTYWTFLHVDSQNGGPIRVWSGLD
jgi:hypothetical protein